MKTREKPPKLVKMADEYQYPSSSIDPLSPISSNPNTNQRSENQLVKNHEKLDVSETPRVYKEVSEVKLVKNGENFEDFSEKQLGFDGKKDNSETRRKLKYSRKEMEKLRFVNVKSKKKFWKNVYNGLDDNIRKEYIELAHCFNKNKHKASRNTNEDSSSQNMVHDAKMRDSAHVTFNGSKSDEDLVEWNEGEDSDDEYRSIQRPAFMVDGEPDFESGSPEDGFEYLRRVRWEAAQIPKVKVVKLNKTNLTEQSVYMPKIPDIEKCPPHLAPLMQWEDEFIGDFSELRLALSVLRDTSDATSVNSDSIIFSRSECSNRTSKSQVPLELPEGGPTLSTLLAMDTVTRVGLLNRRILLFQTASNITKDDCAWLFALCAVVETPLDADTCASLRCLLRKCAKLRSEKDEFDDEVIMLNILATIAGKIFRQSEI